MLRSMTRMLGLVVPFLIVGACAGTRDAANTSTSASAASDQVANTPAQERALAFALTDPQLQWGPCPDFMPQGCEVAVLHGDPGKANADIFFKVPPNSNVPRHWHTSAERMVLVSGELEVTFDGQNPVVLRPGTYAYGPPRVPHKASCRNGDPCVLFIAFELPLDAVPTETKPE